MVDANGDVIGFLIALVRKKACKNPMECVYVEKGSKECSTVPMKTIIDSHGLCSTSKSVPSKIQRLGDSYLETMMHRAEGVVIQDPTLGNVLTTSYIQYKAGLSPNPDMYQPGYDNWIQRNNDAVVKLKMTNLIREYDIASCNIHHPLFDSPREDASLVD